MVTWLLLDECTLHMADGYESSVYFSAFIVCNVNEDLHSIFTAFLVPTKALVDLGCVMTFSSHLQ